MIKVQIKNLVQKFIIEKFRNSFLQMRDCCKKQNLWELLFPLQPQLKAHSSPIRQDVLLGIRIYSWMHLTAILIYDFTVLKSPISKFLYLTNVAYLLCWLYFTIILQHKIMPILSKGLEFYAELLFQVSFCLQWLVTLAYWGVMRQDQYTSLDFFWSFNAHGIVLVLLVFDFIFNCFRFVYTQYIAFVVVCSVYLLVLNFPYALAVQPVYGRAMNWVSWETYVFIIAAFVGSLVVYFVSRQVFLRFKNSHVQKIVDNCQNPQIKKNETALIQDLHDQKLVSLKLEGTQTKLFPQ